jgi:DNA-binding CsgD family transcriptional regulator
VNVPALLSSATREVRLMARPGGGPADALRQVDRRTVRPGVRYRILVPDSARTRTPALTRLGALASAGADVRTAPDVPGDALVIDGSVVVLPVDGTARGIVVFRVPSVVATTTQLFERVWLAAVPLTAPDPSGPAGSSAGPVPGTREHELLCLLSAGSTDESAAARLGVSVRTVRRMVAELMHQLDARSRFQAGARAAGRGWLLDRAC